MRRCAPANCHNIPRFPRGPSPGRGPPLSEHYSLAAWTESRFWGVGERDNDILKSISPVDHVQGVTAPILLIHGRDDTVVPYEQSDVMLSALKKAGKPVEMVTLKHEDHWLSTGETRLQMLESTVAFLRTHNPP